MKQKTMTYEQYKAEKLLKQEEFEKQIFEERLKETVEKMMRIVRAETGGSRVYADMLLSMRPNTEHKVNISFWCYKADRADFKTMLELMETYKSNDDRLIWQYEELVSPYVAELEKFLKQETK